MRAIVCWLGRLLLALRYRVRVTGLDELTRRDDARRGMLFLASHPALIDPFILLSRFYPRFRCRTLGDAEQVSRPILRWWADRFGVIRLPDAARHGAPALAGVRESLQTCGRLLQSGENVLLYPAGHIMRAREERLAANSAVETILKVAPEARVVLIRTRGLWGSSFSRAGGAYPALGRVLRHAVKMLLLNGVFFMPRRPVDIEVHVPGDFPSGADRRIINARIEEFFNDRAPPNTRVPYGWWERGGIRVMPEPRARGQSGDPSKISPAVRQLVQAKLSDLVGRGDFQPQSNLSADLGLDSLSRLELVVWIEKEFGFQVANPDMLETVADVMAAASGEALAGRVDALNPVPAVWFRKPPLAAGDPIKLPVGATIPHIFLNRAAQNPDAAAVADQNSGVRTYRDLLTGIFLMQPRLAAMPGKYLGIMLPASAAAGVVWLTALFAGKIPVMLNWTVGARQLDHMRRLLDFRCVLTSRKLTLKLEGQGVEFGAVAESFVFLEDIAARFSLPLKLAARLRTYFRWGALHRAPVAQTAVVLFTSGSESLPKAVPLSHANILANARDVVAVNALCPDDIVMGFLPPFHSFGLTLTVILPLLVGLRTVYHANPTEGGLLAALIRHYRVTVLLGTPTFLNGILKGAAPDDLAGLRIAVTGAERCPEHVYEGLQRLCPDMKILEGYGITECSPVVAVNRPESPVPFSIGRVLDSLEYAVVNPETGDVCPPGQAGMLLVRGPSVFDGYLHYDGSSPFVEHAGRHYYRTGDLVEVDSQGTLFFKGRLKRFVKLGGEMISLPAIEEVLWEHFRGEDGDGPELAVAAPDEDAPEIHLYTTLEIEREQANTVIRAAGLSPLHNIRRVVRVDDIPVLGTGKTDYRALQRMRADEDKQGH